MNMAHVEVEHVEMLADGWEEDAEGFAEPHITEGLRL